MYILNTNAFISLNYIDQYKSFGNNKLVVENILKVILLIYFIDILLKPDQNHQKTWARDLKTSTRAVIP